MDVQQIGHYRLEGLLGVGGMGEVYRAYDLRRERIVALKLLPEAFRTDTEYLRRFRRESHVAARLREPHVIPIHDFGEIDGRLFIDMRLVDGKTVRELLEEHGAMPPGDAVQIIGQVAEALEAAHADGLVHRDIKPSNVLVTPGGFVYVVDFGIARAVGTAPTALTVTGGTVGTLDYMAPERFSNKGIDGRTDVYSLACMLHECLTGTQPFTGDDLPSLMYAHLYTEPPRPSTVAGIPAAFDAVVAMGMAKSVDDRYQTAAALAAAARAALTNSAEAPAGPPIAPVATTAHEPASVTSQPHDESAGKRDVTVRAGAPTMSSGPPTEVMVLPPASPQASPDEPSVSAPSGGPPAEPPQQQSTQPPSNSAPVPAESASSGGRRRTLVVAVVAVVVAVLVAVGIVVLRGRGETAGTASANSEAEAAPSAVPVAASLAVPTVSGTLQGGVTPGYLEVAPNGRYAYIANRDAGYVSVLDMVINKVTATIPMAAGPPQFVSFAPDGQHAYVSIYNADRSVALVGVIDTRTNAVVTTIPVGKRPFASTTNPDGTLLYVPSHDEGLLDVIDTSNNTVVNKIRVAPNPHWVVFSKDGHRIYTANHESNVVSVLDANTNAILTTIPVGKSPHSTTVSPDGTKVSVVNYDSNTVSVIDTATNAVVATVAVGQKPQDIVYAPDGRHMYTANVDGNTVSVIDTATNQVTATIPIATGPTSIGITPDGKRAYVTALGTGMIYILDLTAS